jgi:D-alanyl-D-alanine carboxypeptidase
MYCVPAGALFGLRCSVFALLGASLFLSLTADRADARWRKKSAPSTSWIQSERYADIVVDGNSGAVLRSSNPDSLRHPASLTKIMTLYLLFERLESGKYKLETPLPVSAFATSQAPTKLGTKAGETISVEDAIKALVTKSANDIAVVIAEAIGGSEDEFAKLMTRKARSLGMTRTVYKNASGLPDEDQVTTARDQALLGLAIQDRFPSYYRYFSTTAFSYRGRTIANHNRLLGRVDGVDGIKTGYTHASGFNLVTSMRRGPRFIVAVVLGGSSGAQRDARMRELVEAHVMEASVRRTAPKVVEMADAAAARPARVKVADASAAPASAAPARETPPKVSAPQKIAAKDVPPRPETVAAADEPAPGSTEPIKPNVVKTISVKAGASQIAAIAPLTLLSPQPVTSQAHARLASAETELPAPPPGAKPGTLGVLRVASAPVAQNAAPEVRPVPPTPAAHVAAPAKPEPAPFTTASVPASKPALDVPSEPRVRTGWIIQVGAFEDITEAKEKLSAVKTKAAKILDRVDPFTEPVVKGDKTFYRARFAVVSQEQAEAACRHLKRSDIACFATRM